MRSCRLLLVCSAALLLAGAALALPDRLSAQRAAAPAALNTYVVNSTADLPDASPFNPVCAMSSGQCTLRAAIMDANYAGGVHTITLPADVYMLTRPGYDNEALLGDLDIKTDLTIVGAGSGATIVDGNGAVTNDRVFKVLSSAQNVSFSGLTIRGGRSFSSTAGTIGGGGLYIEGTPQVRLSNVAFENNSGQNGGGIYANFAAQGGSLNIDHATLYANTALAGGVGAGGALFAYLPASSSAVSLQDSRVYSNSADGTGGAVFVEGSASAQWSIARSEFYSNTGASGGAIGNLIPLTLSDSRLHDNRAGFDGGAIETEAPLAVARTTFDANNAGRFGGGVFDLQTGGSAAGFAAFTQSTLSHNYAQYGGGIYHDGFIVPGSRLTLLNSTLSNNGVYRPGGASGGAYGGGLYVYGGQAQLINSTVAYNRVQLSFTFPHYPGIGGGLYITASATFTALNSLIANNASGNGIQLDTADDCFSSGTVGTLAYDLILTTTNCFVTGPQGGLIIGQDPLLGPLQDNGGETWTRALPAGSPALDNGAPAGCVDGAGAPLTVDQRGSPRPYGARCDIGAFEYGLYPPTSVGLAGPASGLIHATLIYTANVSPPSATRPITYTWQATGQTPLTHPAAGISDTAAFQWNVAGAQVITLTAQNALGAATSVMAVTIANPLPALTSMSPGFVLAGSPSFTLTVTGTNFIAGSVVRWNGAARATSFVSDTQLKALIPSSDVASRGSAAVRVFNATPGGGDSNALNFAIRGALYLPVVLR